jgi:hypothetical protein
MHRSTTIIAALGAALVVAVPAFGKGQPVQPQWMQALELRGEALNRQYGLGDGQSAQPQWIRALELRGEALNLQHGPQAYPESTIAVRRAIEARQGDSGQSQAYPESTVAVNRAIEARQRLESATRREVASMLDARERAFGTKLYVQLSTRTPSDVFERAVAAGPVGGSTLDRFVANDNRFQPRPTNPTVAVSVSSGSEIEWPQLGIGFGVGIVLVLGLMLAIRATRQRPLAH